MSKPPPSILQEDPRFAAAPDFGELRERGLEHLATLSGDLWTDHNLHDPGITILEVLCYALTDLGYRTALPTAELFAPAEGAEESNFFTPAQILTNNPLTLLDYRKLLVDIPGIRNAWIEPAEGQEVPLSYRPAEEEDCAPRQLLPCPPTAPETCELILRGLYRVLLDVDPLLTGPEGEECTAGSTTLSEAIAEVSRRLHGHRNLCEDFLDVQILRDEFIGLCLEVELAPKAEPNATLEAVFLAVEAFISPQLRFHDLRTLLEQGTPIEEIFRGRPDLGAYFNDRRPTATLSHGFVDEQQLASLERPIVIRASDLHRVIMDVPGVRAIRSLRMINRRSGVEMTEGETWELQLRPDHRPLFDPDQGSYKFFKGQLRVPVNWAAVADRFRRRLSDFRKYRLPEAKLDSVIPYGRHREDLTDYFSIQREFPVIYGLKEGDLSATAPALRKAQAWQLRGYLSFFDQLLANYFAQLSRVRELFSWSPASGTYFGQSVESIPGVQRLLRFAAPQPPPDKPVPAIVSSHTPFQHPLDRDQAVAALISDFLALTQDELERRTEVVAQEDGSFTFEIQDTCGRPILRGDQTYQRENSATAAAREAGKLLLFQGGVAGNYRHDNYPNERQYGFTILDRPESYGELLKRITESPSTFAHRRNELLDHLLARFDEQFTDYTLLMYALNQEQQDPLAIIQDKENFLADYPRLSRDRGRAFDLTRGSERRDGSANLAGMERRVAALMGIDAWGGDTLTPFSVHQREQAVHLVWYDFRGRVLLRSIASYPPGADGQAERESAAEQILARLATPAAYRRDDCPEESVFGYTLLDANGRPLAIISAAFPSAERREEHLRCTLDYFAEPAGLRLALDREEQSYYFALPGPDGTEIYLRTPATFPDEAAASAAGLALLAAARDADHYSDTRTGARYGFELTDETGTVVAFHPPTYPDTAQRDSAKQTVADFFFRRRIEHRLEQAPDRWSWSSCVSEAGPILRSRLAWQQETDARTNWSYAVELAGGVKAFTVVPAMEAFLVELRTEAGLTIAESGPYPDRDTAHTALVALADYHRRQPRVEADFNCTSGSWRFHLLLNGESVLSGSRIYPSTAEAAFAFWKFTILAREVNNYVDLEDPDGCLLSFAVIEAGETIATHAHYYEAEEAHQLRDAIIAYVTDNFVDCAIGFEDFTWHYRLRWDDCKGHCRDLLVSRGTGWLTEKAARTAAEELIDGLASAGGFTDQAQGTTHSFGVVVADELVADHPFHYLTPQERDQVKQEAENYLADYYRRSELPAVEHFVLEDELYVHCKSPAICPCDDSETTTIAEVPVGAGSDCILSAYRLQKPERPIAEHPEILRSAAKRDALIDAIHQAATRGRLAYQIKEESASGQAASWRYYLYSPEDEAFLWLRSTSFYEDAAAARRAGETVLELLAFRPNYVNDDVPEAGIYRIRIAETLLEGVITYADDTAEANAEATDAAEDFCLRAWEEGLSEFLLYGTEEAYYYDFLDAQRDCRHGFRVVEEEYRLARNPRETHTPVEREELLDWLYAQAVCEPACAGDLRPYDVGTSVVGRGCRFTLVYSGEEHWRSVQDFDSVNAAIDAGGDHYTRLLNCAQELDFYLPVRAESATDGSLRYRLRLINEAGEALLESPATYQEQELNAAIALRMRRARLYPLYAYGEKYGFQVFSFEDPPGTSIEVLPAAPPNFSSTWQPELPGEVIWESVREYGSLAEATQAYRCYCRLSKDRRNYQRLQSEDCNLFGLELTRPDKVLAEHPRRYSGTSGLAEAKQRTLQCINGEGLRLVEHLLLRPRADEDRTIPNICPAPPVTQTEEILDCPQRSRWKETPPEPLPEPLTKPPTSTELVTPPLSPPYVAGADPYSYWATVVLPYWPRRFQNANFRAFFEDTLRREAPAHVALKICWLDPKQFYEFEQRHHRWLETLGREDNCGRSQAQNELIDFLATMTSVYPPARLRSDGCAAGTTEPGAVLLGSTQLS